MKMLSGMLCFLFILIVPHSGSASESIGRVHTASGAVSIERAGKQVAVVAGDLIFENDKLVTGADGILSVLLKDDTALSLDYESQMVLDKYVYESQKGKGAMVLKMIKGIAGYFSGEIGKTSPGKVKFETPLATIGIRGTKFFVKVGN